MANKKVIIIGRPRTGTASVTKALEILGYDVVEKFNRETENIAEDAIKALKTKDVLGTSLSYDVEDIKKIQEAYPDAVFILTERQEDRWYASWIRYHNSLATEENPRESETAFKNKNQWVGFYYNAYNTKVKQHFWGKVNMLSFVFGTNTASWGALCSFLKKPVPVGGFPYENMSRNEKA